jgi:hypothetical protein
VRLAPPFLISAGLRDTLGPGCATTPSGLFDAGGGRAVHQRAAWVQRLSRAHHNGPPPPCALLIADITASPAKHL